MNNMRPNHGMKRGRGRGRHGKPGGGGGGGGGGANRTLESNGPDVKIRGNAHHIYEKYQQLARDANSSGDRVMAENYLQHAEHYYRVIVATQGSFQPQGQPQQQQPQQANGNGRHPQGQPSEDKPGGFQGLPGPATFPGDDPDGDAGEDEARI